MDEHCAICGCQLNRSRTGYGKPTKGQVADACCRRVTRRGVFQTPSARLIGTCLSSVAAELVDHPLAQSVGIAHAALRELHDLLGNEPRRRIVLRL